MRYGIKLTLADSVFGVFSLGFLTYNLISCRNERLSDSSDIHSLLALVLEYLFAIDICTLLLHIKNGLFQI